ncbi:MAG: AAA family ATPase, partial [Verrucomicrobiota bacterium]
MLSSLRVKNLALVQDIQIEFEPGLNVVTGETGAGKSILIGALKLLLGERADKSLIRSGEKSCSVEAIFDLDDPTAIDELLEGFELDPTPEGQLILRRVIRMTGASQNLVNDSPVTLQAFRRMGRHLVDMHGPYDHQSLLHQETQLQILDAFGQTSKTSKEMKAYATAYAGFQELERRKTDLLSSDEDIEAQVDLLSYRVREIEEAALEEGEETRIQEEHQVAGNAQRILELSDEAVRALAETDDSATDRLAAAKRALDDLARVLPEAETWAEE